MVHCCSIAVSVHCYAGCLSSFPVVSDFIWILESSLIWDQCSLNLYSWWLRDRRTAWLVLNAVCVAFLSLASLTAGVSQSLITELDCELFKSICIPLFTSFCSYQNAFAINQSILIIFHLLGVLLSGNILCKFYQCSRHYFGYSNSLIGWFCDNICSY